MGEREHPSRTFSKDHYNPIAGISFLDTDYTDDHGLGLYCLNNGVIVQTMLAFHKYWSIYEIKNSVTRLPNLVGQVSEIRVSPVE